MAIEIREVVVKASVNKDLGSSKGDFITKTELEKAQDKLVSKILSRVRDMLEEQRAFR